MNDAIKEIKSIAIELETEGMKLYRELANKTLHPMVKAVFRSFVIN